MSHSTTVEQVSKGRDLNLVSSQPFHQLVDEFKLTNRTKLVCYEEWHVVARSVGENQNLLIWTKFVWKEIYTLVKICLRNMIKLVKNREKSRFDEPLNFTWKRTWKQDLIIICMLYFLLEDNIFLISYSTCFKGPLHFYF